ncbi:hypothetical protein R6U77_00605 [Lysinibacillus louembei]|uniref:Uncharacterized protein n=1 Tax=Lysinibacillus louembei TaxID=1470088 RepID=A0ABZ0RXL3_9BACI|nr:hypothetical protein [Lysinibacillus louembei]WPK12220.1 hypothetical protein R6U77_00605 [Lysinibacillus louembei]
MLVEFNEDFYKKLISYERIHEKIVAKKYEIDEIRLLNPSDVYSGEDIHFEFLHELGEIVTNATAREAFEEELNELESAAFEKQVKSKVDLRYFIELKSPVYRYFFYNYYIYAKKIKNGAVKYIAENSETDAKNEWDKKHEMIKHFAEIYHYLHKGLTEDEMYNYVEEQFKYI